MNTRIAFVVLLTGVSFIFITFMHFCVNESSDILCAQEESEFKKIQPISFSVDSGNIYFYDPNNKTIYIYSQRGKFRRAYKIERLGLRLQTINSSDIREMISEEK